MVTFEFEQIESTASPMYLAKAIEEGDVKMQWTISTDDPSQLETLAADSYAELQKPNDY